MSVARERLKRLLLPAKALVTLGLCAALVWKVDWAAIRDVVLGADPVLIAIVFIAMVANVLVSSLKWRLLLLIHGVDLPYGRLYRYYFSAFFLNNFLPTNIGGDGYRIYKTIRDSQARAAPVLAVLMERITGLAALLIIGVAGAAVSFAQLGDEVSRSVLVAGLGAAAVGLLLVLALAFGGWARLLRMARFPAKLRRLLERLGDYRRRSGTALTVALISFTFHLFLVAYRLLLVFAVGASCSYPAMAVVVAVSTVAALVPISLNGIGLLDGSYVFLLTRYGVGYEQALLVMVLVRALQLPLSLLGGVFYFLDREALEAPRLESEEIKVP